MGNLPVMNSVSRLKALGDKLLESLKSYAWTPQKWTINLKEHTIISINYGSFLSRVM